MKPPSERPAPTRKKTTRKPRSQAPAPSAPPKESKGAAPPTERPLVNLPPAAKWGAAAIVAALLLFGLWLLVLYPSSSGPNEGHDAELTIDPDDTAGSIADKLEAAGLIASPRLFSLYVTLTGGADAIVRGPHYLTDDASPRELLARLERRPSEKRSKVTFPEGWNRFQMAKRLQEKHICTRASFLAATLDKELMKRLRVEGDSMEGFLFPATYDLAPDSDPTEIVVSMKEEFERRFSALEQKHASGVLDLSRNLKFGTREIVTLASMVEKEAAVDEDRPLIASVFLNRLGDELGFHPKYLDCDPTAGYGCLVAGELGIDVPSCAGYAGKITPAMNQDPKNPYGTYKHERLPPGPIANPGVKSLEAVVAPASTRYLYFVATGERRHTFSESLGAHSTVIKDGGRR